MSQYAKALKALQSLSCPECDGVGGIIYGQGQATPDQCPACRGTGATVNREMISAEAIVELSRFMQLMFHLKIECQGNR